jgi:hypothetical protein
MEWKSVSRAAAVEWIYSIYREIWDVRVRSINPITKDAYFLLNLI